MGDANGNNALDRDLFGHRVVDRGLFGQPLERYSDMGSGEQVEEPRINDVLAGQRYTSFGELHGVVHDEMGQLYFPQMVCAGINSNGESGDYREA